MPRNKRKSVAIGEWDVDAKTLQVQLREQGANLSTALQQLQTEPVVDVVRMEPSAYNRSERDYRYPCPERNRNNYGGNKYRQRWRDHLDVWRPNYDDDDDFDQDRDKWTDYVTGRENHRYGGPHPSEEHRYQYNNNYHEDRRQNHHFDNTRSYSDYGAYQDYNRWQSMTSNRNTNRGRPRGRNSFNFRVPSNNIAISSGNAEKAGENKSENKKKEETQEKNKEKETLETSSLDPCSNPEVLPNVLNLENCGEGTQSSDTVCDFSNIATDVPPATVYLDVPMEFSDSEPETTNVGVDCEPGTINFSVDSINTTSSFMNYNNQSNINKPPATCNEIIKPGCDKIIPEVIDPEKNLKDSVKCNQNCETSVKSIVFDKTKTVCNNEIKKVCDSSKQNTGENLKQKQKKEDPKLTESNKDKPVCAESKSVNTHLGDKLKLKHKKEDKLLESHKDLSSKRKSIDNTDINISKFPKGSDIQKTDYNVSKNTTKPSGPKEKPLTIPKPIKNRRKTIASMELLEDSKKQSQPKDVEEKPISKKVSKAELANNNNPTKKKASKKDNTLISETQMETEPSNLQSEVTSKTPPAKISNRRKSVKTKEDPKEKIQPNKTKKETSDEPKKVSGRKKSENQKKAEIILEPKKIVDRKKSVYMEEETTKTKTHGKGDEQPKKIRGRTPKGKRSNVEIPTEIETQPEEESKQQKPAKIIIRRKTVSTGSLKSSAKQKLNEEDHSSDEFEILKRSERAKSEGRVTRSKTQGLSSSCEVLPLPRERGTSCKRRGSRSRSISRTREPKPKRRARRIIESDDDSDTSAASYKSSFSEKGKTKKLIEINLEPNTPKIISNLDGISSSDPRVKRYRSSVPSSSHSDNKTTTTENQDSGDTSNKEKKTILEKESPVNKEQRTIFNQESPKRSQEEILSTSHNRDLVPHGKSSEQKRGPPSSEKRNRLITLVEFRESYQNTSNNKKGFQNKLDHLFGADDSDDESSSKRASLAIDGVPNKDDPNNPSGSSKDDDGPSRNGKRKLSLKGDDLCSASKKSALPWDYGLRSTLQDEQKGHGRKNQEMNKKVEYRRSSSASQASNNLALQIEKNWKNLEQRRSSNTPPVSTTVRVDYHVDPKRSSLEGRPTSHSSSATGNNSSNGNNSPRNSSNGNNSPKTSSNGNNSPKTSSNGNNSTRLDIKAMEHRRLSNTTQAVGIGTDTKKPEEKSSVAPTEVASKNVKQDKATHIVNTPQKRLSPVIASNVEKPYLKYLDYKMKRRLQTKPPTSSEGTAPTSNSAVDNNSITLNVTNDRNENYIVHMTDKTSKILKKQRFAKASVIPEFVEETTLDLEVDMWETKTAHKYSQPKLEKFQKVCMIKKAVGGETCVNVIQEIKKPEKKEPDVIITEHDLEIIDLLSSDEETENPKKTDEIKNVESINNLMRQVFEKPTITPPPIPTVTPPAIPTVTTPANPTVPPPAVPENLFQTEIQKHLFLLDNSVSITPARPQLPNQVSKPIAQPQVQRLNSQSPVEPQLPAPTQIPSLMQPQVPVSIQRGNRPSPVQIQGTIPASSAGPQLPPISGPSPVQGLTHQINRPTSIQSELQNTLPLLTRLTIAHQQLQNSNQARQTTTDQAIRQQNNLPVSIPIGPISSVILPPRMNQIPSQPRRMSMPASGVSGVNPNAFGNNQSMTNNGQVVNTNFAPSFNFQPNLPPRLNIVSHNDFAANFAVYFAFHIKLVRFANENFEVFRKLGLSEQYVTSELAVLINFAQKSLERMALKFVTYFEINQIPDLNCKVMFRLLDYYINQKFGFNVPPRTMLEALYDLAKFLKATYPNDFTNWFYRQLFMLYYSNPNQNNAAPNNVAERVYANQIQQQGEIIVHPPFTMLQKHKTRLATQIKDYLRLCVNIQEPPPKSNPPRRKRSRTSSDNGNTSQILQQMLLERGGNHPQRTLPPHPGTSVTQPMLLERGGNHPQRTLLPHPGTSVTQPMLLERGGNQLEQGGNHPQRTLPPHPGTSVTQPMLLERGGNHPQRTLLPHPGTSVAQPVLPNYPMALQMLHEQVSGLGQVTVTSNNVQRISQEAAARQQYTRCNTLPNLAGLDRYVPPNVTISLQQNPEEIRAPSSMVVPPTNHMEENIQQPEITFPVPNDNYRIRLPLSRPFEPPVSADTVTSSTAPVAEATAVPNTTDDGSDVSAPPSNETVKWETPDDPTSSNTADSTNGAENQTSGAEGGLNKTPASPVGFVKCEEIENEIIDVDEWFLNRLNSDVEEPIINFEVKTEDTAKEKGPSDDPPEPNQPPGLEDRPPPPRIASVDSGFSSPPSQIAHPEIMLDRICICFKRAELVCQCQMAIYCSRECQINNWPNHREICLRTRK